MTSVLLGISTFAQNSNNHILGKWTNEDQSRVLEFLKNGSEYVAIIRHAESASLIGEKQITSLQYEKGDTYKSGTFHIIQKDRTAKCSVKLISQDQIEMKVSIGFKSKSQVWTRLDPNKSEL